MDAIEREDLLARIGAGVAAVEDALAGITVEELDRQPDDPNSWTARQVAHHLADSESMAYVRLRRLIAEDRPLIAAYDEAEWAKVLHYDRPVASSVAVFRAVRLASLELLRTLSESDWQRSGTHSDSGRYGVEEWVRIYADHAGDHAAQIRAARSGIPATV